MFDNIFVDFAAALVALALAVVAYYKYSFLYWKRKNVPYLEPKFPNGNTNSVVMRGISLGIYSKVLYKEMKKRKYKYGGIYLGPNPALILLDLELIKNVWIKDFQYFTDRGIVVNEKDDPINAHLFTETGTRWRNLRVKFTPTFTSGKMKMMFHTLVKCGEYMQEALQECAAKNETLDIKKICASYTVDVIGLCVFGINCNSFKDPNAQFLVFARDLFEPNLYVNIKRFLLVSLPKLSKAVGVRTFKPHLEKFFFRAVKDVITYRENNNIRLPDFMQLLIDMKNGVNIDDSNSGKSNDVKSLTMNEIVAQAVLFFIAGFETSSTTMHYCLYELARNPDVQSKVRAEIREVYKKNGNTVSYETIKEMKYLGQVVDETLRLYPPVPTLSRECVKDYIIPETDVTIEKGTVVFVPAFGIHHDPEYFPNPEKFDPDRFNSENVHKIRPFSYLPFGDGPRKCIGLRFGQMQVKVGLFYLLKDFEYSVSSKTNAVEFDKNAFLLLLKNVIYLDIKKAQN